MEEKWRRSAGRGGAPDGPFALLLFQGTGEQGSQEPGKQSAENPPRQAGLLRLGVSTECICVWCSDDGDQTSTVNNVAKSQLLCRIYAMANYTC